MPIAEEAVELYGTEVPEESLDLLRKLKVAIKGPMSVEKMKGRILYTRKDGTSHIYPSNNNAIRQELNCYACPRPAHGIPGISGKYENLANLICFLKSKSGYKWLNYAVSGEYPYTGRCTLFALNCQNV